LGKVSGCLNAPHWTRNDILDLQRVMPMKISVESGSICNQTMMGERLEKIGKVWIVDETDCFRLDVIEKMERGFRITTTDMGVVRKRRLNLRFVYT